MAMTFDMGGLQRQLNPPRNPGVMAIPTLAPQTPEEYAARYGEQPAVDSTRGVELKNGLGDRPVDYTQGVVSGVSSAPVAPAPVVPAVPAAPAAPVDGTRIAYESSPIGSRFVHDLEYTDLRAKLFAMAGLGKHAEQARALHMQLQLSDVGHKADVAARAFVAGDVSKAIDLFNHTVPNGNKVVAYAKNPDSTYTFELADGTKSRLTGDQIGAQLATIKDPNHLGKLMEARAKSAAEMQSKLFEESFKQRGRIDLAKFKSVAETQQMLMGKELDHASRLAIAKFQAENGQSRVSVDMMGRPTAVAAHNGKVIERVMGKDINGKPMETWTEVQFPGAASQGTTLNQSMIPIPSQYAR